MTTLWCPRVCKPRVRYSTCCSPPRQGTCELRCTTFTVAGFPSTQRPAESLADTLWYVWAVGDTHFSHMASSQQHGAGSGPVLAPTAGFSTDPLLPTRYRQVSHRAPQRVRVPNRFSPGNAPDQKAARTPRLS